MDILNISPAALAAQIIAFLLLIWVMKKYLFGPINGVLEARQNEVQLALTRNPRAPNKRLLELDRDTLTGPMYAAARATGRTSLPPIDQIADFGVMEEVFRNMRG